MSARHIIRARRPVAADLSFMGTLSAGSSLTRATVGTYHDNAGALQSAAIDAARFSYDPATLALRGLLVEPARTNSIINPRYEGGANGTPGTAPTNMTVTSTGGALTRTLTVAPEAGMPAMDLKFTGTSNSTGVKSIAYTGSQEVAAVAGQTWTYSEYLALPAGSLVNWTSCRLTLGQNNAAGGGVAGGTITELVPSNLPVNAALATQRKSALLTITNATVAFVTATYIQQPTNGNALDATVRHGGPQLELGAFATSLILPGVGTPGVSTRAADVLTVAAPDGNYIADVYGGTNDITGSKYSIFARVVAGAWTFVWPDAAVRAGERHLQRIVLRRLW